MLPASLHTFLPKLTRPFRSLLTPSRTLSYGIIGLLLVLGVSGTLTLSGCGGGGGGGGASSPTPTPTPTPTPIVSPTPTPLPIGISIDPTSYTVFPGDTIHFAGIVENSDNQNLLWSVQEGAAGGSVTDGYYTAPATAGVYHLRVQSAADPSKSAVSTITVPVVVLVTPEEARTTGQPIQLTASVNHPHNQAVVWDVPNGAAAGTVTQNGLYTPPKAGGRFLVRATSAADPTSGNFAIINVDLGGAVGVVD